MFHISTDYVFDGRKRTPYQEDDPVNPISVYGRSKLEGERQVLERNGAGIRHLILRTSWLYGFHRTNFVEKILEAAKSRPQVEAVAGQVSCLTWTRHLAQKIAELAAMPVGGILHVAGSGQCSRYEAACRIVEKLPHPVPVLPIDWGKLNLPAKRPAYSAMVSRRLAEIGLEPLPDWKPALDEYLRVRETLAVKHGI